jgi:hypothetical protein
MTIAGARDRAPVMGYRPEVLSIAWPVFSCNNFDNNGEGRR